MAIGLIALALLLALDFLLNRFPGALVPLALLAAASVAAIGGLSATGTKRVWGYVIAGAAALGAVAYVAVNGQQLWQIAAMAILLVLGNFATRRAYAVKVPLPAAEAPGSPVLFFNPKSGGGKAEDHSLDEEAAKRGIRTIELTPDADLERLVRDAVAEGADGLAMAGGDGSQAIVAMIAAEFDLPYACVPAGTRNHFALDLGVDRDDVVGALDAFVEGGERRVDLAEVNGRVFVNNVSLGLYAEAVQSDEYRDAKIRTLLQTLPKVMGESEELSLEWKSPSGKRHRSGAAILVSNNRYRLGGGAAAGTRPRIDDGLLGVAVLADPAGGGRRLRRFQKPWRDWQAPTFEVDSDGPVAAGIDGESATIDPPLRFGIRPGVLKVRISREHPGASPSAAIPEGTVALFKGLFEIALGTYSPVTFS